MASAVRVRLDPEPAPGAASRDKAPGCRVSLTNKGKPPSEAKRSAAKPAKISFFLRRFSSVREQTSDGPSELASLKGQLELERETGVPRFTLEAAEGAVLEQPNADPDSRLFLTLELDPQSFAGIPSGKAPQLVLPKDTNLFRKLELEAKLEVGGAPEAELGASDVFDLPLPLPEDQELTLELSDDLDRKLADIELRFEIGGTSVTGKTDAGGVVTVLAPLGEARVAATSGLDESLAERDPKQSRSTPFPPPTEVLTTTPGRLKQGVAIARPLQKLMVVAFARLSHGVRATGWEGLKLAEPGSFALEQDEVTQLSVLNSGASAKLLLQKEPQIGGNPVPWLDTDPQELSEALVDAQFEAAFGVMAGIPVFFPEPEPPEQAIDESAEPIAEPSESPPPEFRGDGV
ncbi:MAG: hypothetical protein M3020_09985 [Myxococcota bacterium]|jgi:hypothetical protein|nr:hypothetical protein [Myxococcota bacterium]